MSSRHTRRKASKAKQFSTLCSLAQAERARQIDTIVRSNLAAPIERNYYGPGSMANLESQAHRGYVCHNRTSFVR